MPRKNPSLPRRLALGACALSLAACASVPPRAADISGAPSVTTIRNSDNPVVIALQSTPGVRSDVFEAPSDQVWLAITSVYSDLGLPLNSVNENTRLAGTVRARIRSVGGHNIAEFFNCGGGFGNAASRYNVYVTTATQATPTGTNSTAVRTVVSAIGKSNTQDVEVTCNTTNALEKLIADGVAARLKQP